MSVQVTGDFVADLLTSLRRERGERLLTRDDSAELCHRAIELADWYARLDAPDGLTPPTGESG